MAPAKTCLNKVRDQAGRGSFEPADMTSAENSLESARQFLQTYETPVANDCTHSLFENFNDWWTGSRPTHKLAIVDEGSVEQLHHHVSSMYDLGLPLTLVEKFSPEMRLFVNVDIWGTADAVVSAEELLDVHGPFVKHFGCVIAELFPGHNFIDASVFDATGVSVTKALRKTSVRLVFPNIIVNREHAQQTRDALVQRFSSSDELRPLNERIIGHSSANLWANVFGDASFAPRVGGVRMPLCDRVSPLPIRNLEFRPFKPIMVLRFHISPSSVEQVASQESDLSSIEWLSIGSIRRDAGATLSEFKLPPRSAASGAPRAPGAVVRVRTQGGSEPPRTPVRGHNTSGRSSASSSQRANEVCVMRQLEGAEADFLEACATRLPCAPQITDGSVVWRPTAAITVELNRQTGQLSIKGPGPNVRSVLAVVSPFTREVLGGVATQARVSHPPSQVFAPAAEAGVVVGHFDSAHECNIPVRMFPTAEQVSSNVASVGPNVTPSPGVAAEAASEPRANAVSQPTRKWKAQFAFEAQPTPSDELGLTLGDVVQILQDPDESSGSNRWVYGSVEATQRSGWFPFSHIVPLDA